MIPKLLAKERLLGYRLTYMQDKEETNAGINIYAVLASLLDLYRCYPKYPANVHFPERNQISLLDLLEMDSTNSFAF